MAFLLTVLKYKMGKDGIEATECVYYLNNTIIIYEFRIVDGKKLRYNKINFNTAIIITIKRHATAERIECVLFAWKLPPK